MGATDSASVSPASATRLRLRRIEPAEIIEHQAPLLGRQPLQLLPGRIAQPRCGAGRSGPQDLRHVHAVPGGGAADALLLLVGLIVREGAAGIEQPVVQTLLALDGLLVEPSRLELAGQLLRLLRERAR